MTESDFISRLEKELARLGVADIDDISCEYREHFACMKDDGHTEEEISALLGSPEELAGQFATIREEGEESHEARPVVFRASAAAVLIIAAGLSFILAFAAAVLCLGLLAGVDYGGIIPPIPYWCGIVYAIASALLSVLAAAAMLFCLSELMRRFNACSGGWLSSSGSRSRLRRVIRASAISFAACFVLVYAVSMLSAGSMAFWHAWHWFGYGL